MSEETKEIEVVEEKTTTLGNVAAGGMPVDFANKFRMARVLCNSGLIPSGLNTPEKVTVALQWGFELGLSPMVAVNNIAVVNGKPTMSADMLHAIARHNPEYAGLKWIEQTDKRAECVVIRKTANYTEETKGVYTWEMAQAAGLTSKDNWKKYPSRMLKHRALSYALRDAFPDVLAGIYNPEEMESVTPSNTTSEPVIRDITPSKEETERTSVKPSETSNSISVEPVEKSTKKPTKTAKDSLKITVEDTSKEDGEELKKIFDSKFDDGSKVFTEEEINVYRKMWLEGESRNALKQAKTLLETRLKAITVEPEPTNEELDAEAENFALC